MKKKYVIKQNICNLMFIFVMILASIVFIQRIIINHKVVLMQSDCVMIQKELYCRKGVFENE